MGNIRGGWARLKIALFGFDAFISYAHKDGLGYAMALENRLAALDYTIFRDTKEMPAGTALRAAIQRGLRRSRILIVVDSVAARASSSVRSEVADYRAMHQGSRPLVGIKLAAHAVHWPEIEEHVYVDREVGTLEPPQPSDTVVTRIEAARERRRVNRVARWIASAAALAMFALAVGVVVQYLRERTARQQAEAERQRADDARLVANAEQANATLDATGGWLDALPVALAAVSERVAGGTSPAALQGALARAVFDAVPVVDLPADAFDARVAISGDNGTVAVASADGLSLWQAASGERIATAKAPPAGHVELSHPGDLALTAATSGAQLWTTAPLRTRCSFPCPSDVRSASLSPDDKLVLVTCDDRTHMIYDAATCTQLTTLEQHVAHDPGVLANPAFPFGQPIGSFAGDSERVAVPAANTGVDIWSARSGKLLQRVAASGPRVNATRLARGGDRVLALAQDGEATAAVWDLGTQSKVIEVPAMVAALSYDGSWLVAYDGHRIALHQLDQHRDGTLAGNGLADPAFSMRGDRVIGTAGDGVIRVWDVEARDLVMSLKGHTELAQDAALSPDGTRLVTSGGDGVVRVWELSAAAATHVADVQVLEISPDGHRVISGDASGELLLWDARTGKSVARLPKHEHQALVAFSGDSRRFVTATDRAVRVFDAELGMPVADLSVGEASLHRVAMSRDGAEVLATATLAAGELRDTARIWNVKTGIPVDVLDDGITAAGFRAGGRIVLLHAGWPGPRGTQGAIHVWTRDGVRETGDLDLTPGIAKDMSVSADGSKIVTMHWIDSRWFGYVWRGRTALPLATAVARAPDQSPSAHGVFSPDGRLLATYSLEPSASVWNVETGALMTTVRVGAAMIDDVQFVAGTTRLVTHDLDQTVTIWDGAAGQKLARFDGVHIARVSPDGRMLVAASGRRVRFLPLDEPSLFARGCKILQGLRDVQSLSSDALAQLRSRCAQR